MRLARLSCSFLFNGVVLLVASFSAVAYSADKTDARVTRVGNEIKFLASDELEGRGVQTEGIKKAAEYIREEFKKLGLASGVKDGSYYQPFQVDLRDKANYKKSHLTLRGPDGQEFKLAVGKEFVPLQPRGKVKAELVFAGYGISAPKESYDDYKGADVAGKVLVLIRREPQQTENKQAFQGAQASPHARFQTKVALARKHKAAGILMINDPVTSPSPEKDSLMPPGGVPGSGFPFAHIKQKFFHEILKVTPLVDPDGKALKSLTEIAKRIDGKLEPMTQPLKGWTVDMESIMERVSVGADNVIAVLEGEGPLADETIVIGAHYDHLGYGGWGSRKRGSKEIHNGADDNATGTSAVLELARRFAERGKKPSRRLVFIAFSGEERGLIGSFFYVRSPVVPLEKTVAMFNFDMIGRLRDNTLTINGVQTAKEWSELVKKANESVELKLRTPTGRLARGSDHYAFYTKNIPIFHFYTGSTKIYHTPEDDFETINVAGTVKVIDFVEKLLDSAAEMPARPTFVKAPTGGFRRLRLPYLGVAPDQDSRTGIIVEKVTAGSPAEKGGIKAGDILVQLDDTKVLTANDLAKFLGKKRPGTKIKVTLKRGEETKTVEVQVGVRR